MRPDNARVSLEGKRHHIGPCRVSLSNRLFQMNTLVTKRPQRLRDLVAKFASARALGNLASLLGLEGHPRILTLRGSLKSDSRSEGCLEDAIYQCDIEARFTSLRHHMKADTKFKAARRLQNNRLCPGRLQVDEWSIFQCVALEHWRGLDHALSERFFSVNRDVLHGLMSLQEYMNRPASAEQPRGPSLHNHDTIPLAVRLGPRRNRRRNLLRTVAQRVLPVR